jgi:hypothetical protein
MCLGLWCRSSSAITPANKSGCGIGASARRITRMGERDAVGFTFVLREIVSGPRESEEAVPIHAVTVSCLMGLGGGAEFWCAQLKKPVKHRIGRSADLNRYQRDYLDSDELGTFF